MNHLKHLAPLSILLIWLFSCQLSGNEKGEKTKTDDAIEGLEPYFSNIKQFPDSILLYQNLVDTLANRGLFGEAASLCNKAMIIDNKSSNSWLLAKGDLYRMAKNYDSAISAYKQYLLSFPEDEQILLNLANTYAEKGDSACLNLCAKINMLYPVSETKASTAFITGLYYNESGNFPVARHWFDSAISLRYAFTEAWMERGYSFFDEKKFEEAEQNFFQLTNLNKGNAEAWYWVAKSAEAGGKTEKAYEYYARAYSLDRNLTDARRALERLKK